LITNQQHRIAELEAERERLNTKLKSLIGEETTFMQDFS
jgi:hypothetical protein